MKAEMINNHFHTDNLQQKTTEISCVLVTGTQSVENLQAGAPRQFKQEKVTEK